MHAGTDCPQAGEDFPGFLRRDTPRDRRSSSSPRRAPASRASPCDPPMPTETSRRRSARRTGIGPGNLPTGCGQSAPVRIPPC